MHRQTVGECDESCNLTCHTLERESFHTNAKNITQGHTFHLRASCCCLVAAPLSFLLAALLIFRWRGRATGLLGGEGGGGGSAAAAVYLAATRDSHRDLSELCSHNLSCFLATDQSHCSMLARWGCAGIICSRFVPLCCRKAALKF